ncbi:methyl-accepting chemotaxis protein [Paenibacillus sp. SAF-054]|uniref:methyl-accepting chemotaxis protein n=1 Tax=unclassified Paenibacillus TaxID=185978 RepID=UPI003F804924
MRISISGKLFGGFAAVLIFLLVVASTNYYFSSNTTTSYTKLLDERVETVKRIKDLNMTIGDEQVSVNNYLLTAGQADLQLFQQATDEFYKITSKLEKLIHLEQEPDQWQTLQGLVLLQEMYVTNAKQMIDAKAQNKSDQMMKISLSIEPVIQAFNENADRLVNIQENLLSKEKQNINSQAKSTQRLSLIVTGIAFLLGLGIAYLISRSISRPILMLAESSSKISAGDLTNEPIHIKNKDEIGDLAKAFNHMSDNLRQILEEVGFHAEHVAASSEELTSGAEQTNLATQHVSTIAEKVAAGSDNQLKATQNSLISIQEIDQTAGEIATKALHVSEHAKQATHTAGEGDEAIRTAISQMTAIQQTVQEVSEIVQQLGKSSERIEEITSFIRDIATKTNLLSLNASIEAARAGESGRGFAVVATEIRKLAEQTSHSGKEIAQYIADIQSGASITVKRVTEGVKEVEAGMQAIHQAGASFQEIHHAVYDVTMQIQDVSTASEHMSGETKQLVANFETVIEISKETSEDTHSVSASTEQQLATMQEIAGSAAALSSMSEDLMSLIGKFKLR